MGVVKSAIALGADAVSIGQGILVALGCKARNLSSR
nr:glutamate synthase-related protein [Aliterella atlantica]